MRITFIEPDGQGGLAHFAYELCQALADRGHDVELITSSDYELKDHPHRFRVRPTMQLWSRVGQHPSGGRWRFVYRAYAVLRRMSRGVRLTREWARVTRNVIAERPDAVLLSEVMFPHLAFAPYAIRRRGITVAQVCHEFTERDAKSRIVAGLSLALSRALFRQFDAIFFLSEATRRAFLSAIGGDSRRTLRIPHGSQSVFPAARGEEAALRSELGLGVHEPVVLYFGYIRPSKGVPELIEAFARSECRNVARLVIAGQVAKFADQSEITAAIARHGLGDRVIMRTGYIPNEQVAAYLALARVVALPYRTASQSGVLHLAYGHARPVVATAVGGLAEDVIEGETGLLVPQGSVDDLARALDRMVLDAEASGRMGERARELAETRFTWTEAARIIGAKLEDLRTPVESDVRASVGSASEVARLEAGRRS